MKRLFFLLSSALVGTANAKEHIKPFLTNYGIQQTVDLLHCVTTAYPSIADKDDFEQLEENLKAVITDRRTPKSCRGVSFEVSDYWTDAVRSLAKRWTEYAAPGSPRDDRSFLPLALEHCGLLLQVGRDSEQSHWESITWLRFLKNALTEDLSEISENWLTGLRIGFATPLDFALGFVSKEYVAYAVQETMDLLNCVNTAVPTPDEEKASVDVKEALETLREAYPFIEPQTCPDLIIDGDSESTLFLEVTDDSKRQVVMLRSLGESWSKKGAENRFASLVIQRNNLLLPALQSLGRSWNKDDRPDSFLNLVANAFELNVYDASAREKQIIERQDRWVEISKSLNLIIPGYTPLASISNRRETKRKTRGRGTRRQATRRQKGKGKMKGRKQRSKRAFPRV